MPHPKRPAADPLTAPTHRRGFISGLLGGAAALAAVGVLGRTLHAQTAAAAAGEPKPAGGAGPHGPWDMSWTDRITGKHREVFDSPEIEEGVALHQARSFMQGFKDVYGATDADMSAVIVVRHAAIPMVLGDTAWDRFDLNKKFKLKLKDPTTGKDARRNPFINVKADDKYAMVWADGGLDTLIRRGVTVLACNLAFMGVVSEVAGKFKMKSDDVREQLRQSLVPGVILMPSGIFAVTRAQEAGCNYMKSS